MGDRRDIHLEFGSIGEIVIGAPLTIGRTAAQHIDVPGARPYRADADFIVS